MARPAGSPPAARVLIVDDEVSVTDTVSRALRLEGHEVWAALSAREGLALAQNHRPGAVIVDLRSPLSSTIELARSLRAIPHLARVPMAIVSGDYYPTREHLTELSQMGIDLRFKPLWLDELVALARKLLAAA